MNNNIHNNSINNGNLSEFDVFKYFPPKYDIFGFPLHSRKLQLKENILKEVNCDKTYWMNAINNNNSKMTRTKLLELRQLERKVDLSYDLDKDGYVSGKDLVIAKRYDIDGDGKLNDKEKAAALEGLANNIEADYQWNLDYQGSNRPFRILQKRGTIINSDDFQALQDTYPQHPMSKHIPHVASFSDLKTLRREELKNDIIKKTKQFEESNPSMLKINHKYHDNSTTKHHISLKEIKEAIHRNARKSCGLNEHEDKIGTRQHSPTLAYIPSPKHKTIKDINDKRHMENSNQISKLGDSNYKDEMTRLNEREDQIFSKLCSTQDRMTKTKLDNCRKQELTENIKKIALIKQYGIHRHELPQFSRSFSTKEYWKKGIDYNSTPKISSQVQLKENMKFWKPKEEMLLNEHSDEILSSDILPFKHRFPKNNQNSDDDKLIINVNKINIFKDFDPNNPKPIDYERKNKQHINRWSSFAFKFVPKGNNNERMLDSFIDDYANKPKLEINEKSNPINKRFSMFQQSNKDHQGVASLSLSPSANTSHEENKTMKKNILHCYAMSNKGSDIRNLIRNAPIKTKGFN